MRKIECFIPDDISETVDKLCEQKHQSRAEFNRRAIENYIDKEIDNRLLHKIKEFLDE